VLGEPLLGEQTLGEQTLGETIRRPLKSRRWRAESSMRGAPGFVYHEQVRPIGKSGGYDSAAIRVVPVLRCASRRFCRSVCRQNDDRAHRPQRYFG
jgi:hypothetical protein